MMSHPQIVRFVTGLLLTSLLPTSVLLTNAAVFAQTSPLIRYQGQVADEQGVPLEGPQEITLRLYRVDTGGAPVWAERHPAVPLAGGYFTVLLGETTPWGALDWDQPLWLSIQVGSDPELTPRHRITSVPLAIRATQATQLTQAITPGLIAPQGAGSALDADTVDGQHASDLLSRANHTGTQPASTIMGMIPWSTISGFAGDTSPDSIADDGAIDLGAETRGSYDSTPDTIADDGRITLGAETTGSFVSTLNGLSGGLTVSGGNRTTVSTSGSTITVSTSTPTLTCTTLAQNYNGTLEVYCPAGYTAVLASCLMGTNNILHGPTPPPPAGNWNSWLLPDADNATGVHCQSIGTTQLHLRCCKLQ